MVSHVSRWKPAPADLTLMTSTVHLWLVPLRVLDEEAAFLAQTLSADEHIRASHFFFERDQRRFIVGRGRLRVLLAHYLDIDPAQLEFYYTPQGKPALKASSNQHTLHFNVSHSEDLALYAISFDRPLGVDIEAVRPIAEADQIARTLFSNGDYVAWSGLAEGERLKAFFKWWTRTEAYVKASGYGLAHPWNEFDTPLACGEPVQLATSGHAPKKSAAWSLWDLAPAPGYVGALVVRGSSPGPSTAWRKWPTSIL